MRRLITILCLLCLTFAFAACVELDGTPAATPVPELDLAAPPALQSVTPITIEFQQPPALLTPTLANQNTDTAAADTDSGNVEIGITSLASPPPATAQATSQPAATAIPTAAPVADTPRRFAVDGLSLSTRDLLSNVSLTVTSAEIDEAAGNITFDVAFSNGSDEPISLIGDRIPAADWRLIDNNGNSYTARSVDDNLSRFVPAGGFAPGGANVGRVSFDLPSGPQPYELAFASAFDYAPMNVWVDGLPPTSGTPAPDGSYALGVDLYSSQEVLRPLTLRVEEMVISAETVTISVSFVNQQRRGYTIRGVDGGDAWLLGANGAQTVPSEVSDSIRSTIAPPDGWPAYSEHRGTITFPRPEQSNTLRFIFNGFSPLTLSFGVDGLESAEITSATGGPAPAPPPPDPTELAFSQIELLLTEQAGALLSGNGDRWANTFTPDTQTAYADSLRRTAAVPLDSVLIALGSSAELDPNSNTISDLDVSLTFEFAEMVENPFRHSARYDLVRNGDSWLVTAIRFETEPPFWWNLDLVQQNTAHFLLFATEEGAVNLADFEREAETAWTALRDRGLPIDDRYLAYYTATQQEFSEQAGGNRLQLGIARSRYQIIDGDLTISNRIFYINGESFANMEVAAVNERQVTVTHELVHLVVGNLSRPFSPPWLTEGIAVYYSDDVSAETRRRLIESDAYPEIDLMKLTSATSLGAHDFTGSRASAEYAYAGQLYRYLVETYGEIAVLNFYRSYNSFSGDALQERIPRFSTPFMLDNVMASISGDLTPELVEQAFNVSLERLEREFRAWLEE